MKMLRSRSSLAGCLRAGLAAFALLPAGAIPADAAPYGAYPRNAGTEVDGARRIDLSVGRSVIIELPRDAKEVFVANPAVANAVVRSARKMFLIGVAGGGTSVIATDAEGRQIAAFEVTVGRDLNPLRQTLQRAIPTARIDVRPAGDSILLTGTVQTAGDAQQAADIARAFVGMSTIGGGGGAPSSTSGGAGASTGLVINALTIAERDQVMIKVTVVEMQRTAIKQLGINVGGNWNVLDAAKDGAVAMANPASGLVGFATGILAGRDSSGGLNFQGQAGINKNANIGGTLQALEKAGVSRVLAEPTLVAISGESATFHAGGEIPIVVTATCPTGQYCPPTVTYKPYGVALAFTPIALSPGRISLRVSTEVNELDKETMVNGNVGFKTRKTSTTVELPSGGTMVTAGLIQSQTTQTLTGIPGLINLPVLGALFRSRDFQRQDSELMIMVTPYLAKPQEAAQVARPDDGFQDSSDPQALLMGRLNRLYGTSGPGRGRQMPGRFGFITD
ncbi:type II and III secretion system protein family protein [Enterovirga sp.]|uniref:type II and III secretion system protein family protein n=1 Tax=Enterovirga sp. TaxID=2026350 RepID=UPI002BDB924C|nr:type II and III secretion system protein family protein [Enterovirga sp.]HMO28085.1 type II and III secretion system protein family protein [Enterovirga sp.]